MGIGHLDVGEAERHGEVERPLVEVGITGVVRDDEAVDGLVPLSAVHIDDVVATCIEHLVVDDPVQSPVHHVGFGRFNFGFKPRRDSDFIVVELSIK